jgi:adenosine deaminase
MHTVDPRLSAFVHEIPKTETHLHIEGALPYELLHEWQPERFPAHPHFHDPGFRFSSFTQFDETLLGHALPWFTSVERYHEAARAIFARHVADNVRYVETSFHLPVAPLIRASPREIIAAIRQAVPPSLEVRIFAGMVRTDYSGSMKEVIDDIVSCDDLAGVDLHGHESLPTEAWAASVWRRAREAGKVTKCHAGEFDGAHRVREAIEELGVTRVQHGIRAIEDPLVVALAADLGVVFDICPISNLRLGVVPSLAVHPIRELRRAGVVCTVSTDDPLIFANRVSDEYDALAREAGFDAAELAQIAIDGWRTAMVPGEIRRRMIATIEESLLQLRSGGPRTPASEGTARSQSNPAVHPAASSGSSASRIRVNPIDRSPRPQHREE